MTAKCNAPCSKSTAELGMSKKNYPQIQTAEIRIKKKTQDDNRRETE
jgi:hypothetical protein